MLNFPFEIPKRFLRNLGYGGDRKYVAVYWNALNDSAVVNDSQPLSGCFNDWVLSDLLDIVQVRSWLIDNKINLGEDAPEQHWLIVSKDTSFVVTKSKGLDIIMAQTVE